MTASRMTTPRIFIQECGVEARFIFAVLVVGLLAPGGIAEAMVAGELARQGNFIFAQEKFDGLPTGVVAGFIVGVCIVAGQEFGNPEIPDFAAGVGGDGAFSEGFLGFEFAGIASGFADANAIAGGFADDLVVVGVAEFDPPKRRFCPMINIGHIECARVCPCYQKSPKTFKEIQVFTSVSKRRTLPGVRIPLSPPYFTRGFSG